LRGSTSKLTFVDSAKVKVRSILAAAGDICPANVTATFNSDTATLTFSAPLCIDGVNAHSMDVVDGVDVCVSEGSHCGGTNGGEFQCAVLFS
jgi:hypothetical protein